MTPKSESSPAILPATGTWLIVFGARGDEIEITRRPIVAWLVVDRVANPITVESIQPTGVWAIEHRVAADVVWIFPEQAVFDTLDQACQFASEKLGVHA